MNDALLHIGCQLVTRLNKVGEFLPQLALRLILAWEFGEAGWTKLNGENWFIHVQDRFPFPFDSIPVELSWFLATWTELLGAAALILGLATRFVSVSLIILTIVAISAVHWPADWGSLSDLLKGYAISDQGFGNYKLPLLYIAMLLPLLLAGPGKASLDHWLLCHSGIMHNRDTINSPC